MRSFMPGGPLRLNGPRLRSLNLLLFWPIEKLMGHKVDPKYEGYVNSAFLALLMVLMVYVMFNDVVRIVG